MRFSSTNFVTTQSREKHASLLTTCYSNNVSTLGHCCAEHKSEHDNDINDAEIDTEIEAMEAMEADAMEDVASDIPEFVGQPGGTGYMSNKSSIEFFDLPVMEQMFNKEIA